MGAYRNKEDDVAKISTSIYVTNFPESINAKELFHTCKAYGHLIDSFIPNKRAKNGGNKTNKMKTINNEKVKAKNNGFNGMGGSTFVSAVKGDVKSGDVESKSHAAMVLDDECLISRDLSKALMCRVKVFASLANLRVTLKNEGFLDVKIHYLGEYWVMLEFASTEKMMKFQDCVNIGSWFSAIKTVSVDFQLPKRIAWVEVEGEDIDVYEAYATQESLFSLKVIYVGCFTKSPGRSYVNGDFAFFDCINIDEFSVHELNDMVKKIGFSCKTMMYYSFLKPDMNLDNGLYALGNDEDVRRMVEYIILGYEIIEVFIKHDKTTVFTYIDDAYNTPKHKCVIMEIPSGWKQNDANVIGESRSRHEDRVEDFDPFFGLYSKPVDARNATNKCVGKGKGVALDDDQIHVKADNTMDNETNDGNSNGDSSDSSEHDELVDIDNELVDVEDNMDHFDRINAKTMGNDDTPEFNVDEDFDIGLDVIDTEEFERASD
nr:nucleotide-binding alpha-beta plait domain-containing protein [Tanacetum cinerariifolium]